MWPLPVKSPETDPYQAPLSRLGNRRKPVPQLSHQIPDTGREIETVCGLKGFVVLAALGIDRAGKFLALRYVLIFIRCSS
jgi:hypothetical protein